MKRTSFCSYFGGKTKIAPTLISPRIPSNIKTFVEPFSGSFAVYFQTDFENDVKIVFNDINRDQTNLFYCSKNYNKMLEKLTYHLENDKGILFCPKNKDAKEHYKELYYSIKKSDFSTKEFEIGDYDRACVYAFLLTSAFNACHYMHCGFSGVNKNKLKLTTLINKLKNDYIRNKFDNITNIENMDFEDIIKKYDSPDTYFYIDAPYCEDDGIKEKGNKRLEWYGSDKDNVFGPSSHKRLCDLLKTLKGKWSVSYYDFPELSEWLPKDKYVWTSLDFFRSSASFSDNKKNKGTELLIMNYNISEEEYKNNYKKYNSKEVPTTEIKKEITSKETIEKKEDVSSDLYEVSGLKEIFEEKIIEKDDFWD